MIRKRRRRRTEDGTHATSVDRARAPCTDVSALARASGSGRLRGCGSRRLRGRGRRGLGSRGAGTTLTHIVSDVVPLAAGEAEWDKKSDCRVKVEVHMVQRTGCGSGFGQDRRKHRKWYRRESQNPSCPWRARNHETSANSKPKMTQNRYYYSHPRTWNRQERCP